jgi:hypothetical protein
LAAMSACACTSAAMMNPANIAIVGATGAVG